MPQLIRTFIAVAVPCTAELKPVLQLLREMGSAVTPVAADNLHLTLKFLGDTDPGRVSDIGDVITEETAGLSAFSMDLVGLGAFPRPQRPSVIWAGIQAPESLIDLASRLEKRMRKLRFPKDRHEYNPHLTLARVRRKPPQELFELLAENTATPFGSVEIDAVTLYQSELKPDGAKYSALAKAALTEGPG